MELKELTNIYEIFAVYDIYKHCMYMPTKEKFEEKIISFIQDQNTKILGCYSYETLKGIIVISFTEDNKAEIRGIAVDSSARGQGIGSYMIENVKNTYDLDLITAETDDEAVHFHEKVGFDILKCAKDFGGQKFTRYQCELNC